jgi:hypothetical protein
VASHPEDVPNQAGPRFRRALAACHAWTRAALDTETLGALAALPLEFRLDTPAGDLLIVHATPGNPHANAGVEQVEHDGALLSFA